MLSLIDGRHSVALELLTAPIVNVAWSQSKPKNT